MDYCFLGTEGSHTETVLVVRERPHRMTMSTVVPMKGASLEWVVRRVLAFIKELGLEGNDIVLKTDQEPAIVSLVGEIARRRTANTFPEHSPVSSSQSNGYVERAIQSVSGQIRIMLDALEARLGQTVRGTGTGALAWLIEYPYVLWNRYAVSADGKTAYERLRGKKSRMLGLEFGEKAHWRRAVATGQRNNKLDSICTEGVYLGHKTLSSESIVGNKDGVLKTRTVRRMPAEERWSHALVMEVAGAPWKCSPQVDEAEQVIQNDLPPPPSISPTVPVEPAPALFREEAPRKVYVKTDVLKKIGYTPGCLGCRALQEGRTRVGHSDRCRQRAVETMKETAAGRECLSAVRKREDDFLAKAVQQTDELFVKKQKIDPEVVKGSAADISMKSDWSGTGTVATPVAGGGGDGTVATATTETGQTLVVNQSSDAASTMLSSSASSSCGPDDAGPNAGHCQWR